MGEDIPGNPEGKIEEVKAGGAKGILGLDQMDWGSAGKIHEIWKLEPCCGSPCNPKDGLYCLACWYCCGLCASSKMYAVSLGQPCSCMPHVLGMWCCPWCAITALRYNLRKKNGIDGNIVGDCVCVWCCGCCSGCQHLRASQKSDWDMMPCPFGGEFKPVAPEPTKFIM